MAGAYTAKPKADTTPDVPPGWNVNWTFPGVYPPGYAPDLSLVMTAPATMSYTSAAAAIGSLRDHDTYATREPEDSVMIWTAKVDGVGINLRLSGVGEYQSSFVSSCLFGNYWEAAMNLEFELTEEHIDKTLILMVTSAVYGDSIVATKDISISEFAIKAVFKYELIGAIGAGYYSGIVDAGIDGVSYRDFTGGGQWCWPDQGGWYNLSSTPDDEIMQSTTSGGASGGTLTLGILSLRDGATYEIDGFVQYTDCTAKLTMTITVAGVDYVYTDETDSWRGGPAVEIDADTLVVTQTAP